MGPWGRLRRVLTMIDFQEDVLNDGHTCRNCMGLLRRTVSKPVDIKHADLDADGNPVQDEGLFIASHPERLPWRTSVDDVPDAPVSEAATLFCECGADGAYTRIWTDDDVGADRLRELLLTLAETIRSRGYRVDMRSMAEAANDAYHHDPRGGLCDRPNSIDEVLEAAAAAGVREQQDTQTRARA